MTLDAALTIVHHLAIFGVAGILVAEWLLVRPGILGTDIRRLARVDSVYGAGAGLALAAGFARVFLGAKPSRFYTASTTFWLKTAFAVVGLLSVRPTLRYLGWRRRIDADPTPLPGPAEVSAARNLVLAQIAVFASSPALAAVMARGVGA